MQGSFEEHDLRHNIKNVTQDGLVMVWIDRFSTSKKAVIERMPRNAVRRKR